MNLKHKYLTIRNQLNLNLGEVFRVVLITPLVKLSRRVKGNGTDKDYRIF